MKGLSFPIRLGGHGGLKMSSDKQHLLDDLAILLNTRKYERSMNPEIGNTLDVSIFEDDDVSMEALLKYEIYNILKDEGLDIEEKDITIIKEEEKTIVVIDHEGDSLEIDIK